MNLVWLSQYRAEALRFWLSLAGAVAGVVCVALVLSARTDSIARVGNGRFIGDRDTRDWGEVRRSHGFAVYTRSMGDRTLQQMSEHEFREFHARNLAPITGAELAMVRQLHDAQLVAGGKVIAAGWPALCLTGCVSFDGWNAPARASAGALEYRRDNGTLWIVPVSVYWPGALANVGFFLAIIYGLRRFVGGVRGHVRRGRGLCQACSYDLTGSVHRHCPECGSRHGAA